MKFRMTMFDPPSGWKWGFPKPMPANIDPFICDTPATDKDLKAWLRSEGVPEAELDLACKYSRMWEEHVEIDNGIK